MNATSPDDRPWIDDVFAQVLRYDPIEDEDLPASRTPPLRAWLRAHPTAWRSPRNTESHIMGGGQLVVLLIGEAGAGKTTQLKFETEQRLTSTDTLIGRVDFSQAAELMAASIDDIDRKLGEYLWKEVETSLRDHFGGPYPFRAARARVIIRSRSHYTLDRAKDLYYDKIEHMADQDILNNDAITDAVRQYQTQERAEQAGVVAVQAAQHIPGWHTVFVVDNVDHLGPRKAEHVFAILTGPYIATRRPS